MASRGQGQVLTDDHCRVGGRVGGLELTVHFAIDRFVETVLLRAAQATTHDLFDVREEDRAAQFEASQLVAVDLQCPREYHAIDDDGVARFDEGAGAAGGGCHDRDVLVVRFPLPCLDGT